MQNEIYFHNSGEDIPRNIRRRKKQLYESIKERMEFYFSDANLQKDRFLSQLMQKDPQIDLSIFLKFNRIQQLTSSVQDLQKALKKSDLLELNEDKTKIYRKTPVKEKANVEACTIYVEQLSCDADHEWLKLIFSRYGKVDYISIPKYKSTGKIKGFAFVEFDTPESAKAALEEFEKEGCCLTNHMNPEKLCSIATFEDDKYDSKNQLAQQNSEKIVKPQQIKNLEEIVDSKSSSKRKQNINDGMMDIDSEVEKKKKFKQENQVDVPIEIKKTKDLKINENNNGDISKDKKEKDESFIMAEMPQKKKKNRKKKKSLKTKHVKNIKLYGLQILSKGDWKRLRNKYLNIQKEKMKKLKQHIYKNQLNHSHKQQQQQLNNQILDSSSKPRFHFAKGLILKLSFDEPVKDGNQVNQIKFDVRNFDKVEYVDVEVGRKEIYVRFGDENGISEVMQAKPWENMIILDGKEEEEYWNKMRKDRSEKFENKKKFLKKRGRNKIIDKTEKLMSKRIRLSVDE